MNMSSTDAAFPNEALPQPGGGTNPPDLCLGCGTCAAACPMTGMEGFDPRHMVRLAQADRTQDLAESTLPWLCTQCGRCEAACPMDIRIVGMVREARGLGGEDRIPEAIRRGIEMFMQTGNNLGLPDEDYGFILTDVAEELAEEPGFEDFSLPMDHQGTRLLFTLHNKLVNIQNEDLKHWWKILHLAGESWTLPGTKWEGVNWGLFSGQDEVLKAGVDTIVQNMERLGTQGLMYPE